MVSYPVRLMPRGLKYCNLSISTVQRFKGRFKIVDLNEKVFIVALHFEYPLNIFMGPDRMPIDRQRNRPAYLGLLALCQAPGTWRERWSVPTQERFRVLSPPLCLARLERSGRDTDQRNEPYPFSNASSPPSSSSYTISSSSP